MVMVDYDWPKANEYARNRVLVRLETEARAAAQHDDKRGQDDEYAFRSAIALLSKAARS